MPAYVGIAISIVAVYLVVQHFGIENLDYFVWHCPDFCQL